MRLILRYSFNINSEISTWKRFWIIFPEIKMPAFIVFRNISQFEFYECKFCTNANMADYFWTSILFPTCPHLVTKWSLRDMKIDQICHLDTSVEVLQPKMTYYKKDEKSEHIISKHQTWINSVQNVEQKWKSLTKNNKCYVFKLQSVLGNRAE